LPSAEIEMAKKMTLVKVGISVLHGGAQPESIWAVWRAEQTSPVVENQ
jgi:hypothetical protein